MIFVDTSAWYASVVPTDPNYAAATAWLKGNQLPLLTTNYVVDEILTLLKVRGHDQRALALGEEFFETRRFFVYHLCEADVEAAWQVFRRFQDKDWSFTDCTSKVVMEKLGVGAAFAFDQHFRQFGSIAVVP
jgi:predicted nucleic acid-binding protein